MTNADDFIGALGRRNATVPRRRRAAAARCVEIEHTLARWAPSGSGSSSRASPTSTALGAMTGNQAMQQVRAGSGDLRQRLAGRRRREHRRPRCIPTRACTRRTASRCWSGGSTTRCSAPIRSSTPRASRSATGIAPIVADAEAGFGGPLNAFELMKAMIEAGAAGVHFEDQLVVGEEVRSPGRQGAGADEPVRAHAGGGAPRRRRAARSRRSSWRARTRTARGS